MHTIYPHLLILCVNWAQLGNSCLGVFHAIGQLLAGAAHPRWLTHGQQLLLIVGWSSWAVHQCAHMWLLMKFGLLPVWRLGSKRSIPPVSVLNTLGILQGSKEPASKCCFICATLIVQLVTKAAQIQRGN